MGKRIALIGENGEHEMVIPLERVTEENRKQIMDLLVHASEVLDQASPSEEPELQPIPDKINLPFCWEEYDEPPTKKEKLPFLKHCNFCGYSGPTCKCKHRKDTIMFDKTGSSDPFLGGYVDISDVMDKEEEE